jgi:hypothetical protein
MSRLHTWRKRDTGDRFKKVSISEYGVARTLEEQFRLFINHFEMITLKSLSDVLKAVGKYVAATEGRGFDSRLFR